MSFITWGKRGDLAGDREAIDEPLAPWEQLGYRDDVEAARAFSAAIPGHVKITQDGRVIDRYIDGVAQFPIEESTMPTSTEKKFIDALQRDLEAIRQRVSAEWAAAYKRSDTSGRYLMAISKIQDAIETSQGRCKSILKYLEEGQGLDDSDDQDLTEAIQELEEAFADTGLARLFDTALNEQNPWHDADGRFTDELDALIYSLKGKYKRLGAIRRAWNKVRKFGRKLKSAVVGECDFTESLVECEVRRQLVNEARPELAPDLEAQIRKDFPPPGPGHVFEPGTEEDWFGAVARVVDQDMKRGAAKPGYTPEGKKNYGAFVNVYRNVRKKHSGAVPFKGEKLKWYVAFEGKPKPAMTAAKVMAAASAARIAAERIDYRAGYPEPGLAQVRVYAASKDQALSRGNAFDAIADEVFSTYKMSPARAGTDIAESTNPRLAAIYERLGLTK